MNIILTNLFYTVNNYRTCILRYNHKTEVKEMSELALTALRLIDRSFLYREISPCAANFLRNRIQEAVRQTGLI